MKYNEGRMKMPYVNLRETTCFYCDNMARVKMIFVKTGLYIAVCEDHLRDFANNLFKKGDKKK